LPFFAEMEQPTPVALALLHADPDHAARDEEGDLGEDIADLLERDATRLRLQTAKAR
jgi:hypothetical protein